MRRALALALLIAACARFPELDAVRSADVANAPYPALLPLDTLIAAPEPRATPQVTAGVEARAAALAARARALTSRPVIEPPIRARMQRGVARAS